MFRIIRVIIANHILRAYKRYRGRRPSLKAIYQFLDGLRFEQPFLQYTIPISGQMKTTKVYIIPFDGLSKKPAAVVPPTRSQILLNPEWAARMFYSRKNSIKITKEEQLQRAAECEDDLAFTLGHEMGHVILDRGNSNPFRSRARKRFVNWVNETHADFFSWKYAMHKDTEAVLASMQRKQALRKKDNNTNQHPSWALRMKYIKHFDFNEKLVREIAYDCGMEDEWLFRQVLAMYVLKTDADF